VNQARTPQLREFLLGIQGLAILRHWAVDPDVVLARAAQLGRLAAGESVTAISGMVATRQRAVLDGYDVIAESYDAFADRNVVVQLEQPPVWTLLDQLPAGRALDAACGTGRHTAYLADRGHQVIGVDRTPAMLNQAHAKLAPRPNVDLIEGDLAHLPIADGTVDACMCALALTHLADPTPAIMELGRVTRPGGRVILSDVHPATAGLGYHAFYEDSDGSGALVRNHAHLHTTYIAAFQTAQLTITGCLEPCWTPEALATQRWAVPIPDAAHQALLGLPLILIWELVKNTPAQPHMADAHSRKV
jgi:ubiquinone/menaquinone biosynthesis C-methylase UbiE